MANLALRGVAFITGAGGEIGRSVALGFARHGVKQIAGLDITSKSLEHTKAVLGEAYPDVEFLGVQADLAQEDQISAAIDKVVSAFGRIDFAVNNAGIGQPLLGTTHLTSSDFDKCVNINLRGLWLCEKYELAVMQSQEPRVVREQHHERGAIVNMSSTLGLVAMPHLGIYSSTKTGILGLTRVDALDYARKGIRINAIAPGFVDTALLSEENRQLLKPNIERVPQGRLAQPEEVADAVCFLCCSLATHITGVTIPVDGGFTAT